jgi:DNA-binding MarR family transcriptional regulator
MTKGYVANVEGRGRGRARQVELTSAGRALLTKDPFNRLSEAIEELDGPRRVALASALESILRSLQADQVDEANSND